MFLIVQPGSVAGLDFGKVLGTKLGVLDVILLGTYVGIELLSS